MSLGTILAISALVLLVIGFYIGHRVNSEARHRMQKAQRDEEEARIRRQEDAIADSNEKARKREIIGVLDEVLRDGAMRPRVSYTDGPARPYKHIEDLRAAVKCVEGIGYDAKDISTAKSAYRKQIEELRSEVKELRKALGMGVPVEF